MKLETRDAAIVFADITNSTALFLRLGDVAASALEREWMGAVRRVVPRFDGAFVKAVGDEAMCAFPTVDTAVLAACEIQTMTHTEPFSRHAIQLHIGIHYGPVVIEDSDMYGDTVNVAAFLCTVAKAEQIIFAEATFSRLSEGIQAYSRPIFRTRLKAHPEETTLYQALWNVGDLGVTMSLFEDRARVEPVPGETVGLLLTHRGGTLHMNAHNNLLRIGRAADSDVPIDARWVSRRHAHIRLIGHDFYLFDESINGTFVKLSGGEEVQVVRNDFVLAGSGTISPGRKSAESRDALIEFSRDRRSLYRP